MALILIIDDDKMMCDMLTAKFSSMGHQTDYCHTLADGLALAGNTQYDLVFLDVGMPDGSGLDVLPELRNAPGQPEVIIITGLGDPEGAEMAIRSGAWDYIEKGSSLKQITLPLTRALQYRQEKMANRPMMAIKREAIIGNSPAMQACFNRLAQAAASDANVLIMGETGTGKELFARAVHENSSRAGQSYVVVDCAALPESLVENLLFGHAPGAFTGAEHSQEGLIRQAHRGTLFLDEVGELPLTLQKAFLRVLQEHRFRPLGGGREVESDFRLVAATNRDLDQLVAQGRFRQDLLFRLRSLTIELPPLRERMEDLKELVISHIATLCERYRIENKGFHPEFLEALANYHWPGNVRELFNTLERAISAAGNSPTLFRKDLPNSVRIAVTRSQLSGHAATPAAAPQPPPLGSVMPEIRTYLKAINDQMERGYLQELMLRTKGDIKQACQMSGLSRTGLYDRLKKHNIARPTS